MTDPRKNAGKTRGRPFADGNPGRPKGALGRSTALFSIISADEIEKLLRKTLDEANSGNTAAAKLILDRAVPAPKGRPVALALPEVTKAEDIPAALAAVIEAMSSGVVSPEEAAAVSSVIEGQRRAIELIALEGRVAELERKAAAS